MDVKEKMVRRGIIVSDSKGEVMVALCARYNHLGTPSTAEALTLRTTIELCVELRFERVVFESEAMNIIQTINSSEEDPTMDGQVVDDTL